MLISYVKHKKYKLLNKTSHIITNYQTLHKMTDFLSTVMKHYSKGSYLPKPYVRTFWKFLIFHFGFYAYSVRRQLGSEKSDIIHKTKIIFNKFSFKHYWTAVILFRSLDSYKVIMGFNYKLIEKGSMLLIYWKICKL